MKTVGEILHKAREEKGISLEEISKETKINIKYLKAIEANDFDNLPPATFTKGFMQNYAKTVGLDPENVLAIFRRDYDQDERGRIVPRGLSEPVRTSVNLFNPTTTTIALSVAIGVLIIGFFIRQIYQFSAAPNLEVTEPQESAQLASPITITGSTHPQATVTINNQSITIDEDGTFTTQMDFTPGEHTLVVVSTSRGGKERTLQRIFTITQP